MATRVGILIPTPCWYLGVIACRWMLSISSVLPERKSIVPLPKVGQNRPLFAFLSLSPTGLASAPLPGPSLLPPNLYPAGIGCPFRGPDIFFDPEPNTLLAAVLSPADESSLSRSAVEEAELGAYDALVLALDKAGWYDALDGSLSGFALGLGASCIGN